MTAPRTVAWSVGSNAGDRLALLRAAADALDALPGHRLVARSSVYETPAWGGVATSPFLNAVVLGESELSPEELLASALGVEAGMGRVRAERWGDRVIDIDLLAVDGETRANERLTLPHPYAAERAFVLVPWAEVAPGARLGERTVAELAATHPEAEGVRKAGVL